MLPKGPVLMSPDRLFTAINREVIRRRPHEFKIACLKDLKNIFPQTENPFFSGFGNRQTDVISYNSVGVPTSNVFIINPKGEIHSTTQTYNKSYHSLHDLALELFPLTMEARNGISEDYRDWKFHHQPADDAASLLEKQRDELLSETPHPYYLHSSSIPEPRESPTLSSPSFDNHNMTIHQHHLGGGEDKLESRRAMNDNDLSISADDGNMNNNNENENENENELRAANNNNNNNNISIIGSGRVELQAENEQMSLDDTSINDDDYDNKNTVSHGSDDTTIHNIIHDNQNNNNLQEKE